MGTSRSTCLSPQEGHCKPGASSSTCLSSLAGVADTGVQIAPIRQAGSWGVFGDQEVLPTWKGKQKARLSVTLSKTG